MNVVSVEAITYVFVKQGEEIIRDKFPDRLKAQEKKEELDGVLSLFDGGELNLMRLDEWRRVRRVRREMIRQGLIKENN